MTDALFRQAVVRSSMRHDENVFISSKRSCSIRSNAFQDLGQASVKTLSLFFRRIQSLEANCFRDLSQLTRLRINFDDRPPILETNALDGLDSLHTLFMHTCFKNKAREELNNSCQLTRLSFAHLNRLKEVDLMGIPLTSLDDDFFSKSSHLEKITLTRSGLKCIGVHGLKGLLQLNTALIQHNEMESVNLQSFADLPNLKEVLLGFNRIKRVDNSRKPSDDDGGCLHFPKLEVIDLNTNHIAQLGVDTFSKLAHLVRLNLSFNKLAELPATLFKDLIQLQVLDLSHNRLVKIRPGSFDALSKLKKLNLSHNELTRLEPSRLSKLADLNNLNVDGNKIDGECVERLQESIRARKSPGKGEEETRKRRRLE